MVKKSPLRKLPKIPKLPKLVALNKPPSQATKHLLLLLVVILLAFTIFYAFKVFGGSAWVQSPIEKFSEEEKTAFTVKLVYSDGCGHCREFKPKFDAVAESIKATYPDINVKFVKTPAEQVGPYAKFASDGIPAVLFIKGAESPDNVDPSLSLVGNMDQTVFEGKVKSFIGR